MQIVVQLILQQDIKCRATGAAKRNPASNKCLTETGGERNSRGSLFLTQTP